MVSVECHSVSYTLFSWKPDGGSTSTIFLSNRAYGKNYSKWPSAFGQGGPMRELQTSDENTTLRGFFKCINLGTGSSVPDSNPTGTYIKKYHKAKCQSGGSLDMPSVRQRCGKALCKF